MGNLVLIFNDFEDVHLGKDVFLVPYHLGKILNKKVTIVFPRTKTNVLLPQNHRGVNLVALNVNKKNGRGFIRRSVFWLICNQMRIDVLMLFHFSTLSMLLANIYKTLNPKGFLYVKADGNFCFDEKRTFGNIFIRGLYKMYIRNIDRLSFETMDNFKESQLKDFYGVKMAKKSVYMPNGFDEEQLQCLNIKVKEFKEKENLIIYVGRIGTYQKNTEMFLEALSNVDLKNWKVHVIGPINPTFQNTITSFYMKNPSLKDNVLFIGNISDQRCLWEYYNRARVFVLTSRYESFALVLGEARRFRDYIITTDVGCARDFVTNSCDGIVFPQNCADSISKHLQNIINGKVDVSSVSIGMYPWEEMIKLLNITTH